MWLVVALEDRAIDLKRLGTALGAGRLSFGSPERLRKHLGVEPGSVTPFALINDAAHQVTLVLDTGLKAGGPVNAHPLTNTMTSALPLADLLRFFDATGHPPRWLDFPLYGGT
jgi:Ala-tRNA(Pro) deacylase